MALGTCPDCGGVVSTTASSCPHCGNTKFSVPTGRKVKIQCWCSSKLFSGDLHGYVFQKIERDRFGPHPCSDCNDTSYMEVDELRDVRDGSLGPA